MSDLIDRQALLKQIDIDSDGEPGYYGDTWKFIDTIKNMPNVHDLPKDTDTISRKAAIDALRAMQTYKLFAGDDMLLIDQAGAQTELMLLPPAELGTNLAEVGTDVHDINVGELISRQSAIDRATKEHDFFRGAVTVSDKARRDELLNVMCWLGELPSAQPERIKGHWIDAVIPNDSGGLPVIVCDKCNTFFPLQFGASHNFCPNCGADMRGEQDDEIRSNSNAQTDTRARGMGATDKSSGI